ncbi:MAG: alpha-L-fucosidase [Planctomycetota bacterium]|jgi:alpha-L-fucosidase
MKRHLLVFSIILVTIGGLHAADNPKDYEPTRDSLSQYTVPEWYHDAKIGFFYHWGPHTVVGEHFSKEVRKFFMQEGKYAGTAKKNPVGQWAMNMYPKPGKPDHEQNATYIKHKEWYGDPKEFGYKDLIPLMSSDGFDPEYMVRLLDEAGVKYIVPQAIHHDGFAMWDSKVVDEFNAAKMGPKVDTVKMVIDAARKRNIKVGVSTHAARHSWYYSKLQGYDTSDPRYRQLYGEGLEKGIPKPEAIKKWEDTMDELIQTFHPDYIFVDGGTADTYRNKKSYVVVDAFRRVVANYYNSSRKWGGEPVITFKRESLWKEEAVPDYEGGILLYMASYKWQAHMSICGWFYRKENFVIPTNLLFRQIVDVVSKNGNALLNLAIKPDGSIQEVEVKFLKEMAQWTNTIGEGIYATRPWRTFGEVEPGKEVFRREAHYRTTGNVYNDPEKVPMVRMKLNAGDIRFTQSKDKKYIYVIRASWPEEPFTISSLSEDGVGKDVKIRAISLLGSDAPVKWEQTKAGIIITPPSKSVFKDTSWPVAFKMEK